MKKIGLNGKQIPVKQAIWIGVGLIGLALLVLQGQGCSPQGFNSEVEPTEALKFDTTAPPFKPDEGASPHEEKMSGLAVLTSEQILTSFTQMTGVKIPQSAVIDFYVARSSTLPERSELSAVTAPLLLNVTNIASMFCIQLYDQEVSKPAKDRLYLEAFDPAKGPAQIADTMLAEIVRKMARNFWGRNENAEELLAFKDFYVEYLAALTAAEKISPLQSRGAFVGVCSAALSSLDAITY